MVSVILSKHLLKKLVIQAFLTHKQTNYSNFQKHHETTIVRPSEPKQPLMRCSGSNSKTDRKSIKIIKKLSI